MIKYCLLLVWALVAHASVLGIDFGTEFIKASLISPGKSFTIVENLTTKRKTENAIAFYNKERVYETDAAAKKSKSPKNTFTFLNKFLGALSSDQAVVEISKHLFEDFQFAEAERHGGFAFLTDGISLDNSETLTFKVEELLGMILKYIVRLVDHNHGVQVKDCVLTVPSEWGISQRLALKAAAAIADLEVLSFINENTAVALYYGLERQDNQTHTALFYNLGSYNVQVSVVEYTTVDNEKTKKKMERVRVLADYSVPNVGGQNFDHALATYLGQQFDSQPSRQGKKSIFTNPRAFQKLMKASNKFKEILSANKDVQVYVEALMDNEDFSTTVQRGTFEEIIAPQLQKLLEPIQKVLEKANKQKSEINIVELVGGGIRVPKVQQVLTEFFEQVEVGTHLNGDESMALGAAFHAANLSHSFKVRPIQLLDGPSFNSSIQLKGIGDDYFKDFQLFSYKKRYGSSRSFEFNYDHNLELLINISKDEETIPYMKIMLTNITNATELNFSKPEVQLTFKLSSNEFIQLESAQVKVEETKLIEIKPNVTSTNSTQHSKKENEQKNAEDQANRTQAQEEQDNSEEEQNEESETNKNSEKEAAQETTNDSQSEPNSSEQPVEGSEQDASNTEQAAEEKPTPKAEPQFKKQKIVHTFPVNYTVEYLIFHSLSKAEIDASKAILKKIEEKEEKERKLSEVKNSLESLIYSTQENLEVETFQKFSTAGEREVITTTVSKHYAYLDSEEAWSADFDAFNSKYTELSNMLKPIYKRYEEYKGRPAAVNLSISQIQNFTKKALALNTTQPWITEERKVKIFSLIQNVTEWLNTKITEQNSKELHEDPVFLLEELKAKVDAIEKEYLKIKAIPKPRKVEKDDEEKKGQEDKKKDSKKDSKSDSKKESGSEQKGEEQAKSQQQQQDQQQQNEEQKSGQQQSNSENQYEDVAEDL